MADNTAVVHSAITLGASPTVVTTAITSPVVPRRLSITGDDSEITGNVVVVGTDENDVACTDTIAASGISTVFGAQIFKTVTQITVPVKTGISAETIAIGVQDRLFSLADARSFDQAQLTSSTDYPNALILSAETRIAEWLENRTGVSFLPRYVVRTYDGTGEDHLYLSHMKPLLVVSVKVDGVALTSAQIDPEDYSSGLALYPSGCIKRRSGTFAAGQKNVSVGYWYGYNAVPEAIKRAALLLCTNQSPAQNMPYAADGYDDGNVSVSFMTGDGYGGNWSAIPEVAAAIKAYNMRGPGVA